MGWKGVMMAKSRENRTRENCESGNNAIVPLCTPREGFIRLVAGQVVVGLAGEFVFYDCISGLKVANVVTEYFHTSLSILPVCDRWLTFRLREEREALLDCVTHTIVHVPQKFTSYVHFDDRSISGSCVAYLVEGKAHVFQVVDTFSGTKAQYITTVDLFSGKLSGKFVMLCHGGTSFVHLTKKDKEKRLIRTIGVISLQVEREFSIPKGWYIIGAFPSGDVETDYVLVVFRYRNKEHITTLRLRDGTWGAFEEVERGIDCAHQEVLVYDKGVVCVCRTAYNNHRYMVSYFDYVSSVRRSRSRAVFDTSGALLVVHNNMTCTSHAHWDTNGCYESFINCVIRFRYGVAVFRKGDDFFIVHFA